jgi:hypothetical protein
VVNLIKSIPVGIDNALEELGVGRLLGTMPSGPYGVGPAVARSADHCDEQRVGPLGTLTLRTRCART